MTLSSTYSAFFIFVCFTSLILLAEGLIILNGGESHAKLKQRERNQPRMDRFADSITLLRRRSQFNDFSEEVFSSDDVFVRIVEMYKEANRSLYNEVKNIKNHNCFNQRVGIFLWEEYDDLSGFLSYRYFVETFEVLLKMDSSINLAIELNQIEAKVRKLCEDEEYNYESLSDCVLDNEEDSKDKRSELLLELIDLISKKPTMLHLILNLDYMESSRLEYHPMTKAPTVQTK